LVEYISEVDAIKRVRDRYLKEYSGSVEIIENLGDRELIQAFHLHFNKYEEIEL